jgi:hypothetical protein
MPRQCTVFDARLFCFVTFSVRGQNVIGWAIKLKPDLQHQRSNSAKPSRHNYRITTDRVAAAITNSEPQVGVPAQSALRGCRCQCGFIKGCHIACLANVVPSLLQCDNLARQC